MQDTTIVLDPVICCQKYVCRARFIAGNPGFRQDVDHAALKNAGYDD